MINAPGKKPPSRRGLLDDGTKEAAPFFCGGIWAASSANVRRIISSVAFWPEAKSAIFCAISGDSSKNLCKNRFIVHVLCSFLTVHRIELTSIHAWLLSVVCS